MCGLAGFYPKKGKMANIDFIFAMGIMNENRGTDSCGISIGDYVEKGIAKESDARTFIEINKKKITNRLTSEPIIFHTRKSTYGTHTYDNAHPFHWYMPNDKKNYFVFAHNGTLDAWRNMIDSWNIQGDSKLATIDSHALGLAMFKAIRNGQDFDRILTKYKGAAAFLGYTGDTFFVWKGASNNIVERPMYYIENADGWYFHSQEIVLSLLFPNKHVYEVDNNTLITFKNNKLFSKTEYKREFKTIAETAHTASQNVKELFKKINPLHMLILNSKTLIKRKANKFDKYESKKSRKHKAKYQTDSQMMIPFDVDNTEEEEDLLLDFNFPYSCGVNANINSYNYAKYTSSKGAILNGTYYFKLSKINDDFIIENKYSHNPPDNGYIPIIFINGIAFYNITNSLKISDTISVLTEKIESCTNIQQLNELVDKEYRSSIFKNLASYMHVYNDILGKHVVIYKSVNGLVYAEVTEDVPTLITFYEEVVGVKTFKALV
jgi:predicted glutamine amidotransferase